MTEESTVDSRQGQEIFPFSIMSRWAERSQPASYTMNTGTCSFAVKLKEREAVHSPLSVEITNSGAIRLFPHTSSWRGAHLIKVRNHLTFTVTSSLLDPFSSLP